MVASLLLERVRAISHSPDDEDNAVDEVDFPQCETLDDLLASAGAKSVFRSHRSHRVPNGDSHRRKRGRRWSIEDTMPEVANDRHGRRGEARGSDTMPEIASNRHCHRSKGKGNKTFPFGLFCTPFDGLNLQDHFLYLENVLDIPTQSYSILSIQR